MTLADIWRKLLFFLTGNEKYSDDKSTDTESYAAEYADKSGVNFLYIACSKLANYTVTDSTAQIKASGGGERIRLLNAAIEELWQNMRLITARSLGCGKYAIFPYFDGAKIRFDYAGQTQLRVLEMRGSVPVDLAVLCESKEKNGVLHSRFRRYRLEGTTHTISEIFASGDRFYTDSVLPEWTAMTPLVTENTDKLLFAFVDCPIDARNDSPFYRAKLTDGADAIIADINEQLKYLEKEYKLKESRIFVDSAALGVDERGARVLKKDNIYAMLDGGDGMFEVFNPEIRSSPLFERLKFSLALLEKQIGVSSGIFTEPESLGSYANRSNIKRTVYDTYALVTAIRANIRSAALDVLYACGKLLDAYGIKGGTDYELNLSWSNAMIEDADTEYQQYKDLADRGAITTEDLKLWVTGNAK